MKRKGNEKKCRQIAGCEAKRKEGKAGSQEQKWKCDQKGEINDYINREDVERYIFIIIHEHEWMKWLKYNIESRKEYDGKERNGII